MIHKKEMNAVMRQHFKTEDDYTYENVMDALDNYSDRLASKISFNLPVSGSLFDVWQSKLEYANKHDLILFSFHFENKTYLSEFRKAKWCDPYQIAEL